MAHNDYDDEPRTAEEMLEAVRHTLSDVQERLDKLSETVDDAAAGLRRDVAQGRKEILEMRTVLGRLQARFDNQLLTLALANIASGVGVAGMILAATHAFA